MMDKKGHDYEKKSDIIDFENLIGECSFENSGKFLKEMKPGDIYIIYCRPNSDRDLQIYQGVV